MIASDVTLGFGGQAIRFEMRQPGARLVVRSPHTNFILPSDADARCVVRCEFGQPVPGDAPIRFDAGSIWDIRTSVSGGDEVCFHTATAAGGREPFAILTLDDDLRGGRLVRTPSPSDDGGMTVGFPLDEYLAARLLARSGGLVLHASCLLEDGEALLFMGHSGAGKSTMAELAEGRGADVLSDDRTILTVRKDGRVVAWGTPWHGSYTRGSARSAPVAAIFLLVQDARDAIVPLPGARAFGELLVRLVRPTVDRRELELTIGTAERVAASVRCAELRFRPTPAAYDMARSYARA
ncbi:MAG: hypothetical protein WKG32_14420 [Gemmatimonadaceae bacterium]